MVTVVAVSCQASSRLVLDQPFFADTTYYACWKVGQPIENRNITNETEIKILQEKFAHAKSESHVWAWVVFTILVIVTAIVIISEKCILKDDHLAEG